MGLRLRGSRGLGVRLGLWAYSVSGLGLKVQGLGFKVQDLAFWV